MQNVVAIANQCLPHCAARVPGTAELYSAGNRRRQCGKLELNPLRQPVTSGGRGSSAWCAQTSVPNIQVLHQHLSQTVSCWAEC